MTYTYKCVAAPEKARRAKGAKTRTDRVAVAMQELIEAEASQGWEYLRTDLVPVEEKTSFFSRSREIHRAVLIFRRPRPGARTAAPVADQPIARPAPAASNDPAPEAPIRLAADRQDPEAPASPGLSAGDSSER